jgi:hypothetical protein
MTRSDTPFPKHWRYHVFINWAVTAGVVPALKLFGAF